MFITLHVLIHVLIHASILAAKNQLAILKLWSLDIEMASGLEIVERDEKLDLEQKFPPHD
jgi:hypothetical protein